MSKKVKDTENVEESIPEGFKKVKLSETKTRKLFLFKVLSINPTTTSDPNVPAEDVINVVVQGADEDQEGLYEQNFRFGFIAHGIEGFENHLLQEEETGDTYAQLPYPTKDKSQNWVNSNF